MLQHPSPGRNRTLRRTRRSRLHTPGFAALRGAAPLDGLMMRRAIDLAKGAAAIGEVPVGAVVYRGRRVLGEGFNQRESQDDPTAHAEMIALRQAAAELGSWRLSGCRLAVTLEPCPMCAGAIVNARVDQVIYGAADPKMGAVDSLYAICTDARLNHRCPVIGGVMSDECGRLLRAFFRRRRAESRRARR